MKERAGEIQWGRASRLRDDLWPEPASKLPRASPARLLLGSTGARPGCACWSHARSFRPGRRWQGFAPAISLPRAACAEITL